MENKIPIEVSNRHIHLSKQHIDILFGKNYELKKHRDLSQPGQFSAHDKIVLVNGNRKIENVRVLGPERKETQVELSKTDSIYLKINTPLRESGDLTNSCAIKLMGPKGSIHLDKGAILSKRHLHASEQDAKQLGLRNKDIVSIAIPGQRGVIFNNVLVRVNENYKLVLHLDTDEGNAAHINKTSYGRLIKN